MKTVWYVLAWFVIVAPVVPWIRLDYWWIRGWDFPRLQIVVLGIVWLLVYGLIWRASALKDVTVILLILSLGWQVYKIYPYTPIAPQQVMQIDTDATRERFALMIANVYMGKSPSRQASRDGRSGRA